MSKHSNNLAKGLVSGIAMEMQQKALESYTGKACSFSAGLGAWIPADAPVSNAAKQLLDDNKAFHKAQENWVNHGPPQTIMVSPSTWWSVPVPCAFKVGDIVRVRGNASLTDMPEDPYSSFVDSKPWSEKDLVAQPAEVVHTEGWGYSICVHFTLLNKYTLVHPANCLYWNTANKQAAVNDSINGLAQQISVTDSGNPNNDGLYYYSTSKIEWIF